MSNAIFIYGLTDPRDKNHVRYVGKTKNLPGRLAGHLKDAKRGIVNHKCKWIRKLLEDGVTPCISILDVASLDTWVDSEMRWISILRSEGHKLTNATDGGEGMCGHVPSEETRRRMSAAVSGEKHPNWGKQRSATTRAKVGAAHRGRKVQRTPEHQERIAASQRGVPRPQYAGANHPRARLSADDVREIRSRLASGETGAAMARRFRVSDGTVSSIKVGRTYRDLV